MGEEDILFYRDTAPTGLQSFVTQTRILSVKEDLQIVKNILIYLTPSTRNLQFGPVIYATTLPYCGFEAIRKSAKEVYILTLQNGEKGLWMQLQLSIKL
ncbi:MAG: hypothetical protein IPN36_06960 [Bacteroidetes bacterium]|nr:hypothetical protein [Bacteroidota bacterium]